MLYYRPLFWSADRLVFVCEAQRRYWQRRGAGRRARTDVIYNGVDTEHWRPERGRARIMRRALGFAEGDLVVGMSRGAAAGEEPRCSWSRRSPCCAAAASRRARC